mgnify:CR=1 FL=1
MYDLKDYLNSINYKKNNLMVEDGDEFWEKKYPAHIVNKCLWGFADTVLFANEMNGLHHMDKKLQYDFYLYGLPKKKRFSPWMKASKIENLDLVKEYFGDKGMLGYVQGVQRKEIRQGIACVKHQNMAGSDMGDDHKEYFAGEAALK